MRPLRLLTTVAVHVALATTAFAASLPPPVIGKGLKPAEAAKAMTVPPGFKVALFAGEPDVHQPIAFTIDERGRLWVVENYSYPTWKPEGNDRVVIYEDTDGDGHFDKRTVFYDKLNFATAIAVGMGGVWVGSAPHLIFIPDRNHDDIPDGPPEPVLDGWGHRDTHETLNSLVWGPDGWLYGNQGIFTDSAVQSTAHREIPPVKLNACVWRYHPTKKIFEVFAAGMSNQWGLDFNDLGHAFVSACVIPHLYHVIQGGHYRRQVTSGDFSPDTYARLDTIGDHVHWTGGSHDRFIDNNDVGGGHAHAGALIYLGDSFPAEYRGAMLMHNLHGNRINRDILEPSGSGYIGRHGADFMKANDAWFRGLRLEVGPDGSLFNSDWYDAIACHGQGETDRTNGRIYRISYGDPKKIDVNLAALPSAELVQLQLHRNDWFVRRARLILQERGPDPAVHAALIKILRENPDVTRQLRALWALHVTGGLTESLALELLKSPEANVRAWTIQLTCEDCVPSAALLAAFAALAQKDPSPVVRLYLASAAQRIAVAARWPVVEALLAHGEDATDHNLPLMAWFAAEPLVPADPARALALAAKIPLTQTRAFLLRRAAALPDTAPALLVALTASTDLAFQRDLLAGLLLALEGKTKPAVPAEWPAAYAKIAALGDADLSAKADALAARYGDATVLAARARVLGDDQAALPDRRAALAVLLQGRDPRFAPLYQKALATPALRADALRGLSVYDDPGTPAAILPLLATLPTPERRTALNLLMSRPAYARALLAGVKAGTVPRPLIDAAATQQLRLLKDEFVNADITAVLGALRDSPKAVAQEISNWKKTLTPAVLSAASPSRGRAIFAQTCQACHTLYGEGGKVGPELTGSNRADLDYIITNIVDPNAAVGKDYFLTTVETTDHRTVGGIVARETPQSITILNLAETVTLPRDQIKKIDRQEISLMPPGLLSGRPESEVADLIAYLRTTAQVPLPQK